MGWRTTRTDIIDREVLVVMAAAAQHSADGSPLVPPVAPRPRFVTSSWFLQSGCRPGHQACKHCSSKLKPNSHSVTQAGDMSSGSFGPSRSGLGSLGARARASRSTLDSSSSLSLSLSLLLGPSTYRVSAATP